MATKHSVTELGGGKWIYSDEVEDHFFRPRNVMFDDIKEEDYNAQGEVGSPACGDQMRVWLKIEGDRVIDFKWKTYGCASAIAATSILSEMAIGKTLDEAYKITPQDITEALGGLPKRKIHCSVLGDQALRVAIDNFRKTQVMSSRPKR